MAAAARRMSGAVTSCYYCNTIAIATTILVVSSLLVISSVVVVNAVTDAGDVAALTNLYLDLQQPAQLWNWKINASAGAGAGVEDPCAQNWLGVVCSGANVTELHLSNLGLGGQLGYQLSAFQSLLYFDVSSNNIGGVLPNQLPPSIQNLILARNRLTGSLPYSLGQLPGLTILDISQNAISNGILDIFSPLVSLTTLDLSYNTLTGPLPNSLGALTALMVLNLQNNQLNGSLPLSLLNLTNLQTLNIQNNQFTGWIPPGLNPHSFMYGGNQFSTSPVLPPSPPPAIPPSPPPLSTQSPPQPLLSPTPLLTPTAAPPPNVSIHKPRVKSPANSAGVRTQRSSKSFWTGARITGVVIAVLLLLVAISLSLMFFLWRLRSKRICVSDEEKVNGRGSWVRPLISPVMKAAPALEGGIMTEKTTSRTSAAVQIPKTPPSLKSICEKGASGRSIPGKGPKMVMMAATAFSVGDLQTATNSFAQENLIGEGSLSRVYRGDFPNGQVFAVKKLDLSVAQVQDKDEFLAAVCTMAHLQHANITKLVGYCVEHGQRLLVYQYINRGTLNDALHTSEEAAKRISWNMRIKIALGAARALEYLHEVCLPAMVHRNFKSANILLDDEMNPHLSDCGIAAFTPLGVERQVSAQMLGSFGYSAPEYAMSGLYTMRSDVYSFGVVLLELLTGRKPLDSTRKRAEQSLVRWATPQLHDIDALTKMVDPALKGIYPAKSLSRFADIIALCVQSEPEFRPPMSEVVQTLVRLMQRASLSKRRSGDDFSASRRISEYCEPSDST
ncbi:unnamed protein product [Sphagnum jensenii]|uniref:Protein kinase domain-containing protein n=1 Tax=Sphagnum jensenii TaxID=128206 RepID=A0ABP0VYT0_9BRYO